MDKFPRDNLVDHPPPEVGHIFLVKGNAGSASRVLGVLAGKHAAVRAVHLLWDILDAVQTPIARVQLCFPLVHTFILHVLLEIGIKYAIS